MLIYTIHIIYTTYIYTILLLNSNIFPVEKKKRKKRKKKQFDRKHSNQIRVMFGDEKYPKKRSKI